jgi:hypothetical protein
MFVRRKYGRRFFVGLVFGASDYNSDEVHIIAIDNRNYSVTISSCIGWMGGLFRQQVSNLGNEKLTIIKNFKPE